MSLGDKEELVLGIDPGLRVTGYGLVLESGSMLKAVEFGAIKSTSKKSLPERIYEIVELLSDIISQHRPVCASVEKVFSAVNVKTALLLGHVRGAILAELCRHKVPVFEYSPLEIKQATVGYGRAEKQQVAEMCQRLLGLAEIPKPMDASDALAAAICHIHNHKALKMVERNSQ